MTQDGQITQNSILRISEQKTLEFLDLYRSEECLWNTNLVSYTKKKKRREAADRIASVLNMRHFTGEHVIMKFRNLRSSYMQELKKIATSTAAGDNPVYQPKVFWYSRMEFLRPHLQLYKASKVPTKMATKSDDDERVRVKKEYDDNYSLEELEVEYHEPLNKRARNLSMTSRESFDDQDSTTSDPIGTDSSRSRFESTDGHFESMAAILKNAPTQPNVSASASDAPHQRTAVPRDDCFDSFGKYVSAMLRRMPVQRAMALQPDIVKLLVSGAIDNDGRVSQSDQN